MKDKKSYSITHNDCKSLHWAGYLTYALISCRSALIWSYFLVSFVANALQLDGTEGNCFRNNACCTSNHISHHRNKSPCLTLTKGTLFLSSCTERLVFVTVEEKKVNIMSKWAMLFLSGSECQKRPNTYHPTSLWFCPSKFQNMTPAKRKLPVRLNQH